MVVAGIDVLRRLLPDAPAVLDMVGASAGSRVWRYIVCRIHAGTGDCKFLRTRSLDCNATAREHQALGDHQLLGTLVALRRTH